MMKSHQINRRKFLERALVAGAVGIAAPNPIGRAVTRSLAEYLPQERGRVFAPVKVARNRIIRTVVGLRPFRSQGFVVGAERLENKLLIHNYGHGGSGVTLSWGTASLALDLARNAPATSRRRSSAPRRFAVLGCGVAGLSTARLLQQQFQNGPGTVTIYARELPPHTTSNIAGALWHASAAFDSSSVTETFNEQFRIACRISYRTFQEMAGAEYGVRWIDAFELLTNEGALQRDLVCGTLPYSAIQVHREPRRYFNYPFTRQFSTLLIEPYTYLRALMRDFYTAGGRIVVRDFRSREEIARLPEAVVFNCTGLGAKALFEDENLIPIRGQLEVLVPQPEIDYCYLAGAGHMFPRRDGIILGGTWDRDDWSLAPDPEQTTSILDGHMRIMSGLGSAQ